ncbi:hypothetical protein [Alicyclobacillus dauci]|uniref:Coat F domain-containing protein n=1 Tax=Alicyclobacillus dauci TaxID=1475485 RepID=A0ABY6Z252_9BACL|nr:hypothetical protein [Alicyclobacillus dauci]WAH36396.1 hypothetical protein NZD86_19575 [Alicyclobacillus dauci]
MQQQQQGQSMQNQQGMQNQQSMQNQQATQTPPNTLTNKDLSYLKDGMSWLLNAVKKFNHYANECTDQQVKQAIQRVCQTHQQQYDLLLKHCQTQSQQGGQTASQQTMQ